MSPRNSVPVVVALLVTLGLPAAQPARAHDDGLTCHSHPSTSSPYLALAAMQGRSFAEDVDHRFANLAAVDPSRYPAEEVKAAHRGLAEFGEMVEAVLLLTRRAERLTDPRARSEALELAEGVLEGLPLVRYVAFESFLAEHREAAWVEVPVEVVGAYLEEEAGVARDLVVLFQQSAEGC